MKPVRREDGRMVLNIDNEKDLRTYMQPQRLSILFELESRPEGMTAKQLADALGIAPSSAGHHLGKLEQLGLFYIHLYGIKPFHIVGVDPRAGQVFQAGGAQRNDVVLPEMRVFCIVHRPIS